MLWNGSALSVPPPPAPTQADYENAIEAFIDQTAQSKQYADGMSLASYVASTVPAWAAQATTFVAWRDAAWSYAYGQTRTCPSRHPHTTAKRRANPAGLPTITWPLG
jgi:hypothetical protein